MTHVSIVMTEIDQLPSAGVATGIWLEDLASAVEALERVGLTYDFVTISGKPAPVDPRSVNRLGENSDAVDAFLGSSAKMDALKTPRAVLDDAAEPWRNVIVVGGHGGLIDLASSPELGRRLADALGNDGQIATNCHGASALLSLSKVSSSLLQEYAVTAFSNAEEEEVGLLDVASYRLEDALRKHARAVTCGAPFGPHVVQSSNLVSGQNPASILRVMDRFTAALR